MQSRYVWSGRGGKGRRVAKGEHLGNVVTLDTSQVYSGFWQLLDTLGIKSSQHAGIPLYPAHSPTPPLSVSFSHFLYSYLMDTFCFSHSIFHRSSNGLELTQATTVRCLGNIFQHISVQCHASPAPPSLVARQLSHRAFLYKNFCSFRKQLSHSFRSDTRQTSLHLPGTLLPSLSLFPLL